MAWSEEYGKNSRGQLNELLERNGLKMISSQMDVYDIELIARLIELANLEENKPISVPVV